ncbi:MAG TPA: 3-methyl-2-oxobutanoate hydroxymethyltransferase [Anaerolineales bacterium]|nr:3-methyl-2-oxobutanoate hydroxymethyltransferase [Anaerolineales bacterium]
MSAKQKITPTRLKRKKRRGEKITMLTAYDFPMAQFIDQAGVDVVLVSDAVGTVGNGRPEAISVSVEEMIYHTQAVRNGVESSMVVTTLPFGSYESTPQAVDTAVRLMKEGKADAVHFEGTADQADKVKAIVDAGIPVMGHVGIIKQKIVRSGTIRIQGRTAASARSVLDDVTAFAQSGVFALVLECIPAELGEAITHILEIPTISIGAGAACDGQALVTQDMLGLFKELNPKFLKVYLDLSGIITGALTQFKQEVEQGQFPLEKHSYTIEKNELELLISQLSDLTRR